MSVLAITQARMKSTRLPGKIMKKIESKVLLEIHLDRISKSKVIDHLIVATSTEPEDDAIEVFCLERGYTCYRGSEQDVLDRFYQAVKGSNYEHIIRLTSDCPLIDSDLIDKIVYHYFQNELDYCSNTLHPTYPDGQDVEVFRYSALKFAWQEATVSSDREHVTPYIWRNSTFKGSEVFKSDNFEEGYNYGRIRMTVDEEKDYQLIQQIIKDLGTDRNWIEYAEHIKNNPSILAINTGIIRNEGYIKSTEFDEHHE